MDVANETCSKINEIPLFLQEDLRGTSILKVKELALHSA